MANPQLENGYTSIANEILEAIAKITLSPTGYKILFVVWRQTYGFHRFHHGLSDTFIAKAIDSTPRLVNKEVNRLINKKVLILYSPGSYTAPRQIGFNKDYDTWDNNPPVQTNSTAQTDSRGTVQIDIGSTACLDPEVLSERTGKERKEINIKKNTKEITPDSQEYILSQYLLKKILENNPNYKLPDLNSWAKSMDLIIRVDHRDPKEIKEVIDFCQSDSFWISNILSVSKLRKQYDTLNMKRLTIKKTATGNYSDEEDYKDGFEW